MEEGANAAAGGDPLPEPLLDRSVAALPGVATNCHACRKPVLVRDTRELTTIGAFRGGVYVCPADCHARFAGLRKPLRSVFCMLCIRACGIDPLSLFRPTDGAQVPADRCFHCSPNAPKFGCPPGCLKARKSAVVAAREPSHAQPPAVRTARSVKRPREPPAPEAREDAVARIVAKIRDSDPPIWNQVTDTCAVLPNIVASAKTGLTRVVRPAPRQGAWPVHTRFAISSGGGASLRPVQCQCREFRDRHACMHCDVLRALLPEVENPLHAHASGLGHRDSGKPLFSSSGYTWFSAPRFPRAGEHASARTIVYCEKDYFLTKECWHCSMSSCGSGCVHLCSVLEYSCRHGAPALNKPPETPAPQKFPPVPPLSFPDDAPRVLCCVDPFHPLGRCSCDPSQRVSVELSPRRAVVGRAMSIVPIETRRGHPNSAHVVENMSATEVSALVLRAPRPVGPSPCGHAWVTEVVADARLYTTSVSRRVSSVERVVCRKGCHRIDFDGGSMGIMNYSGHLLFSHRLFHRYLNMKLHGFSDKAFAHTMAYSDSLCCDPDNVPFVKSSTFTEAARAFVRCSERRMSPSFLCKICRERPRVLIVDVIELMCTNGRAGITPDCPLSISHPDVGLEEQIVRPPLLLECESAGGTAECHLSRAGASTTGEKHAPTLPSIARVHPLPPSDPLWSHPRDLAELHDAHVH